MTATYRYRAATAAGDLVEGVVRAPSERVALDELRRQTLVPVAIEAATEGAARAGWSRVSRADAVATAMRTIAALTGGGATLDRALDFASRHANHQVVHQGLESVRRDVQSGQTLASALRGRTDVFGPLAPAMVRAGEESGTLDAALGRLADHLDRARALRTQLRDALVYPALLAIVAGAGVLVLLAYVVPRFVAMLNASTAELPLSTRVLVVASHSVSAYWWVWVGIAGAAVAGVLAARRDPASRARWHAARLGWPVTGSLEAATWTARFARPLAALLGSGAPMLSSLRIAREGVENVAMGSRIDAAIARVERGDSLASAFEDVLPPLAVQLLAVGEESASVDAMALRVADTYDAEVQRGLRSLIGLVEPTLIVLFGGLVGFVALAMLQAIYSINASVP